MTIFNLNIIINKKPCDFLFDTKEKFLRGAKTMLKKERHEKILELLKERKVVKLKELASHFDISLVTIRRDVDELEKEGLIKKIYGGIMYNEEVVKYEKTHSKRASQNIELKRKIAHIAKDLVFPGETLFLDASTTVLEFAKTIVDSKEDINIITNGIYTALAFTQGKDITVNLIGGILKYSTFSLIGPSAEDNIDKLFADKTFISTKALCIEKEGIFEADMYEAEIKKKMIKNSNQVILLVDSTKWGKRSLIKSCELGDIDIIITDKKPSENELKVLYELGIKVIYPKE